MIDAVLHRSTWPLEAWLQFTACPLVRFAVDGQHSSPVQLCASATVARPPGGAGGEEPKTSAAARPGSVPPRVLHPCKTARVGHTLNLAEMGHLDGGTPYHHLRMAFLERGIST